MGFPVASIGSGTLIIGFIGTFFEALAELLAGPPDGSGEIGQLSGREEEDDHEHYEQDLHRLDVLEHCGLLGQQCNDPDSTFRSH